MLRTSGTEWRTVATFGKVLGHFHSREPIENIAFRWVARAEIESSQAIAAFIVAPIKLTHNQPALAPETGVIQSPISPRRYFASGPFRRKCSFVAKRNTSVPQGTDLPTFRIVPDLLHRLGAGSSTRLGGLSGGDQRTKGASDRTTPVRVPSQAERDSSPANIRNWRRLTRARNATGSVGAGSLWRSDDPDRGR